MWKLTNGKLIQETDVARIPFRTNISKVLLKELNELAEENDTHINYLIENGLQYVLSNKSITYNKDLRPKDRIQYKTTYDKELLANLKDFAKQHNLYLNDVIEYSCQFINMDEIKNRSYKHRVE
ncbi:rRNA methyltransferase [Niallia sp. 01092]|uniref:rRNA methyltransferase n=1 Tax=unclassified Niallia TaxID=2837522 RepID=UPI003FD32C6A